MKGWFLVLFLIITAGGSVLSAAAFFYIAKSQSKFVKILVFALCTLVIAIGVRFYEETYYSFYDMSYIKGLQYAAMAGLDWLITWFALLPLVIVGTAVAFIKRHGKRGGVHKVHSVDTGRRRFLKRAVLAPVGAGLVTTFGLTDGNACVVTERQTLTFKSLPAELDGYIIGHISDMHVGVFLGPDDLGRAIDEVAENNADILVITGDLADEMCLVPECGDVLAGKVSRFRDGIYFCYGNHEYFHDVQYVTTMLKNAGVHILRNEGVVVRPQRFPSQAFFLAATDYSFAKTREAFERQAKEFTKQALQGRPQDMFSVLLAHHPDFFDPAAAAGVSLVLSGHTHGGQLIFAAPVASLKYAYLRGLYRQGDTYCYVNRGTGHWLPLRIGCSREITIHTLHTV